MARCDLLLAITSCFISASIAKNRTLQVRDANREIRQYKYLRPHYMEQSKLDMLLELHNKVRSAVSPTADQMLKMTWDFDLEATAWRHSKECVFTSSSNNNRRTDKFPLVGENLWVSWGIPVEIFDPEAVISSWMKEKQYFDASLKACIGGSCERYTQLVWGTSYKLGCAYSWCDDIDVHGFEVQAATFLVCHYGPAGNVDELIPYYHGLSCTFCADEDTCEENLCCNPERDSTAGEQPYPADPPTTTSTVLTQPPLTDEARMALIVIGSSAGCTVVVMIMIVIIVRISRNRAEDRIMRFIRAIPRRLTQWYDHKRSRTGFNNGKDIISYDSRTFSDSQASGISINSRPSALSNTSIAYHANTWRNNLT